MKRLASEVSSLGYRRIRSAQKDVHPNELNSKYGGGGKFHTLPTCLKHGPIPFSMELAMSIKVYISLNIDKDISSIQKTYDLPFMEEYRFEIKRFMIAIKAYYDQPSRLHGLIPLEIILGGITDRYFAKKLKLFRQKCFLASISGSFIEEPEDDSIKGIRPYDIYDIGQIFNYNYWIFWEEDDPEDYLWGLTPENPISDSDIQMFKDSLSKLLPKHVESVYEEEILLANSSSTGLDEETLKSSPVYKLKETRNKFSNSPLRGKRSLIPVSTLNYRDSVILTVPQSNSVKLFEKQLSLICQEAGGSTHFKDPLEIHKAVKNFGKKYSYFYDRDLTKEGITKPRQLIKALLEVLEEKYPHFPCWKYKDIYKSYHLLVDDKWIEMVRGHGLGMGNSLTTLMQAAVNNMILLETATNEDSLNGEIGFLTFNDDYTAGFQSSNDMEIYIEYDRDICKRLQLIPKDTKSHKGEGFVFCEIYYPYDLNDKNSYKLTEIYNTFLFDNICQAKEYFSSIADSVLSTDSDIFSKIISYFGYEFYPNEWQSPTTLGGWISPKLLGVDLTFWDIDLTPDMKKAYFACKVQESKFDIALALSKKKRKMLKFLKESKGKVYNSPLLQLYGDSLHIPEEYEKLLNYKEPYLHTYLRYLYSKNSHALELKYDNLYKKRQEMFNKTDPNLISEDDIYEDFIKCYPFKDILIRRKISEYDYQISCKGGEEIAPVIANPLLSFLKFYNSGKIRKDIIPYRLGLLGLDDYQLNFISMKNRFEIITSVLKERDKYLIPEELDIIQNVQRLEQDEFSINPARVMSVFYALTGKRSVYPVMNYSRQFRISDEEESIRRILSSRYKELYLRIIERFGYMKELNSEEFLQSFSHELYQKEIEKEAQLDPDEDNLPSQNLSGDYRYGSSGYRQWVTDGRPEEENNPYIDIFRSMESDNNTRRIQLSMDSDGCVSKDGGCIRILPIYALILERSNCKIIQKAYEIFIAPDEEVESSEDDEPGEFTLFD